MANQTPTIDRKISESATTTVYRAHQDALDRPVLLKVLHKHLVADEDFVARFRREARACAAIRSDNIVQVYDLSEVDGAPAIVMEYVEGRSLKEILESEGMIPVEFVKRVAAGVLKGLSVAHAKGIIHRDIKPGNILVGSSGTIKVTDFGLASLPRSPTLTLDGMVLGTPAYMSPEQGRGEVVDARSDLFSLGVTLVELLTSRRILDGDSYSECLKKVLSFSPEDVERALAGLPPDLADFLRHLIAPQKEDRFATAEDALQAITEGTKSVSSKGPKRFPWLIPAAATAIVVLAYLSMSLFPTKTEEVPGARVLDSLEAKNAALPSGETSELPDPKGKARKQSALLNPEKPASSQPAGKEHAVPSTDSGRILIRCEPWAKVYLNNIYLGQTPLSQPVSAKAGEVTITFSNPLFVPITRSVVVPQGGQIAVEENFLDHAGYLVVRVNPWAEVYIDDQYRDTTPLTKPLITSTGTRKIRLHNPAFDDLFYDAAVAQGDTLTLSFSFVEHKRQ